jgi:hypothetical protein
MKNYDKNTTYFPYLNHTLSYVVGQSHLTHVKDTQNVRDEKEFTTVCFAPFTVSVVAALVVF